ncbi:MAG: hypothetical protein LQ347_002107 [Umbilicaria vellea]|nr:MAG: hypothetical protein LQ347_002107 [Umbilicaria vellea]
MGYGFSLEDNTTDQCALKMARRDTLNSHNIPASSKNAALENCPDVDIHYVRLPSHRFGDYSNGISALTAFPQRLLDDVSSVVANGRERASRTSGRYAIDKWNNQITRNKVTVMCHLMMVVQKHHAGIVKWDNKLPASPQNQKQFHAARYRASQLHILNTVFHRLHGMLRDLSGLNSVPRDVRVVRLEHILTESPPGFATDFRNALKVGMGTRKAAKIREAGWVDLVFTLWVCGLWLWNLGLDPDEKEELGQFDFNASMFRWLGFLRNTYGRDLLPMHKHQFYGQGGNIGTAGGEHSPLIGLDAQNSSGEDPASGSTESRMIAESYQAVVHVAAASYPDSVFACPEWTVEFLAWGLDIVTQEGFMCPDLEGKEGDDSYDEYMLFMECDQDTGHAAENAAGNTTGDIFGAAASNTDGDIAGGGAEHACENVAEVDTDLRDSPA